MQLTATYSHRTVHEHWHAVYLEGDDQNRFNDRLMEQLLSIAALPKGALWLDGGCGRGDHGARIAARGYRCIGVDLSRTVLPRAKGRGVGLCCSALERLPFPDAMFDGVLCRGVMMHIPRWREALAELCRVLKPGGSLIIVETNDRSLETKLVLLARRLGAGRSRLVRTADGLEFWAEVEGDPFVVRMTTVASLHEVLQTAGIHPLATLATEFWDVNRFPKFLRAAVLRWNGAWLASPRWRLSAGVAVAGRKA